MNDLLRSVGLIVAVALPWTAACGSSSNGPGDGGKRKDGGSSTSQDGGRRADGGTTRTDGGTRADGGVGPAGPGEEGSDCDSTHKCVGKLSCVASIFQNLGVCGRGCAMTSECDKTADEVCFSYSGSSKDGHCVNRVKQEYAICGVADTSVCDLRSCLYLPNSPLGVCVDTCALNSSGASGDDGGVPEGAVMCTAKETCIDGVLSGPLPNEGVCGVVAKRGQPCGIEQGIYCDVGDICAPKDPANLASDLACFQDCGTPGATCDTGKCMVVQNLFAYCM